MENPFTKAYCEVTFVDSMVIAVTVLAVFFSAHFTWWYFTERKK